MLRVCRAVLGPATPTTPGPRRSCRRCGPTRELPAGRERRGLAGDDRPPQGDRRHPGRRPARRSRSPSSRRPRRRPADPTTATPTSSPRSPRCRRSSARPSPTTTSAGLPYAEIAELLGGSADAARRAAADGIAALRRTHRGANPDERARLTCAAFPVEQSDAWTGCDARLAAGRRGRRHPRRRLPHRRHPGRAAAAGRHRQRPGPGRVRRARATTRCCRRWPTGSARGCCAPRPGSTRSPGSSTSTSPAARHAFDVPLDWRLSTGFRATVLHHLRDIAYGTTASYAAVAAAGRQPEGGPRGGHRLRDQPAAGRRALPPGGALATARSAATSAASRPSAPCWTWRRRHELRGPRRPRLDWPRSPTELDESAAR